MLARCRSTSAPEFRRRQPVAAIDPSLNTPEARFRFNERTSFRLGRESSVRIVARSAQQAFHHDAFMRFQRTLDPVVPLALALRQEPENLVVPGSCVSCEHVQKALDGFP